MLRLLIKDITVEKRRSERKAVLHVRWQGGAVEDLSVNIPQPVSEQIRYPEGIVSRVRTMATSMTDRQISATFNQEGVLSAKGSPFALSMVKWIRYRHDIPAPSLKLPDELTVNEVADHFGIRPGVVYNWIWQGQLPARRLGDGTQYRITLDPKKEAEFRAKIANSNRIASARIQNPAVPCAL